MELAAKWIEELALQNGQVLAAISCHAHALVIMILSLALSLYSVKYKKHLGKSLLTFTHTLLILLFFSFLASEGVEGGHAQGDCCLSGES